MGDLQPVVVNMANNFGTTYTFVGDGSLNGPGGIDFGSNSGTLVIANSGSNGFAGPINVGFGTLQVGDGGTNGNLGSGVVTNNYSLVFNRSDALTINNTISGSGTITNLGTGVTTLAGGSPAFDGSVVVAKGTLQTANGAALGSATGTTTVENGATLDVDGQNLTAELITVSGTGVGNAGAIVNSGGQQINALLNVTLAGNTTFGGADRWDIRGTGAILTTLDPATGLPAPFNLTKVGPNQISLVGVTVDPMLANINVQEGTLSVETTTTTLGEPTDTLTVASGATLQLYNTTTPWDKAFVLNGNGTDTTVNAASGPDNTIIGLVTLNGACIFNNGGSDDNLTLSNTVSGAGSLTKTGGSELRLTSPETYTGNTTVSGGTLVLMNDGAITGSPVIAVGAGATLDASARVDGTLTLLSGQTLAGNGTVLGTVMAGAGSTVSPGGSIGELSVASISLGGTTIMEVDAANHTNDVLRAMAGSITYGGTLVITNIGPVTGSNTFQLFSGTLVGTFGNIITPTIGGVTWDTSNINVDGTVTAIGSGVNTTPTTLMFAPVGNTLDISWPQDHIGWRLEAQTNSLAVGITTNWVTIPGSTGTKQDDCARWRRQ